MITYLKNKMKTKYELQYLSPIDGEFRQSIRDSELKKTKEKISWAKFCNSNGELMRVVNLIAEKIIYP